MKVIRNGYTARANPGRGYYDFEFAIEFESETAEEKAAIKEQLREKYKTGFYMWFWVTQDDDNGYAVNYGKVGFSC